MTLENFKKACEYMKENNQTDLIENLKKNLEIKPDEARRQIFNEVFNSQPQEEKSKKSK